MLVVGRVVDAGGEQHGRRVRRSGGGGDGFQRRQQFIRVILDRRDAVAREQVGKQPQHDLPVLQHVRDAGRRARVVLQHVEGVRLDAHHVDAGDVHVNVVRHLLAVHLRPEHRVLEYQLLRHHPGAQDVAVAIDVVDVEVDRLDPLGQPTFEPRPFGRGEHARNDVERDQPLLGVRFSIDREGDADAPEQELRLAPPSLEQLRGDFMQPCG